MLGIPTPETAERVYEETDLNRAVQAYRFFYPTVSGSAIFKENERIGVVRNKVSEPSTGNRSTSVSPITPTLPMLPCSWT